MNVNCVIKMSYLHVQWDKGSSQICYSMSDIMNAGKVSASLPMHIMKCAIGRRPMNKASYVPVGKSGVTVTLYNKNVNGNLYDIGVNVTYDKSFGGEMERALILSLCHTSYGGIMERRAGSFQLQVYCGEFRESAIKYASEIVKRARLIVPLCSGGQFTKEQWESYKGTFHKSVEIAEF